MTWCLYISPPCSIHLQDVSSLPRSVCNKSSALVTFYGAGWIYVSNRPNVFTALLGTICYLYQIPVSSYNVWHTILSMNKCVFWHLDCVPITFVEGIHVCSFYVWIVTNAVFVHFFWGLDHSSNFIWRRRSMIQKRSRDQQRRVGSVNPPPPPRKLAWQREIHRLKMYFLLEDGNFSLACYLFVESCQKLPWPETCQKDGPSQMKSQEFRKTVSRRALPIFLMEWCSCLLDVFLDHMTMTTSITLWLWYILVFYLYIQS